MSFCIKHILALFKFDSSLSQDKKEWDAVLNTDNKIDYLTYQSNYGCIFIANGYKTSPEDKTPLFDRFAPKEIRWSQKLLSEKKEYSVELIDKGLLGRVDEGDLIHIQVGAISYDYIIHNLEVTPINKYSSPLDIDFMASDIISTYMFVLNASGAQTMPACECKEPNWQVLHSPHFDIFFDPQYKDDALATKAILDKFITDLNKEFSGYDLKTLMKKVSRWNVFLYPDENANASQGMSLNQGIPFEDGYTYAIHMLTPSKYYLGTSTSLGEKHSFKTFHRTMLHETATIFMGLLSSLGKWPLYSAPNWFIQGYEMYIGLKYSSKKSLRVTYSKHLDRIRKNPNTISIKSEISAQDPYLDGAVLLLFLHETYGKERIQKIFSSNKKTFRVAFEENIGTIEDLSKKWQIWLRSL